MVDRTITHDRQEESIEAKARWFQSLSLEERMDMLCWFTGLILTANPKIVEQKAGREKDLEDVRLLELGNTSS
jgi:hypothetical protein